MLTPSFSIIQNDQHLTITVHAPYTQLNDVEIRALESEFLFYSSPYFLRLFFSCDLIEDDEPPASFNADKGDFEIRLQKKVIGQHFPDLDLLGTLLAPRKQTQNIKPSIEVLSGEEQDEADESDQEWFFDQELPSEQNPTCLVDSPKYGFGNQTQGIFRQVKLEFNEVIDLPDPDVTLASKREDLRIQDENKKFDSEHYLADFMELEEVEIYTSYIPHWMSTNFDLDELTKEERETLKNLGNKEFLLSKDDNSAAWLSLVDIVFAYAYNYRTTMGENTVESAWTVNKLSATLSWFANYKNLQSVVHASFRRLLTFGLYRNWNLAQIVLKDTIAILKHGRRQVLRCFLEIHSMFAQSEPRYLLNQLYISDYCIWLQKTSDRKLSKLTEALEKITISKGEVGFDLEDLEEAALQVAQEEREEELNEKVKNLKMAGSDESSSSSCDSESSSSDDNSSSSLDSDDESSPES